MSPRHARRLPRLPWFKDERVPGTGLSSAQAMRLFIVMVVVFSVVVVACAFYVLDANSKAAQAARTAKEVADRNRVVVMQLDALVKQFKATQDRNHAARLADQARTNAQIRQIYCLIVGQAPDNPAKPIIGQIRKLYTCGPFNPANVGKLTPGQLKILNQAVPPGPTPKTSRGLTGSAPAPTVTRPAPQPSTTTTTRTAPTPSPTTPPIVQACLPLLPCIHLP